MTSGTAQSLATAFTRSCQLVSSWRAREGERAKDSEQVPRGGWAGVGGAVLPAAAAGGCRRLHAVHLHFNLQVYQLTSSSFSTKAL